MSDKEMVNGCLVKCKSAEGCHTLREGSTYRVRMASAGLVYLMEKGDIGYRADRFEVIEDAAPLTEESFGFEGDAVMLSVEFVNGRKSHVFCDIPDVSKGDVVVLPMIMDGSKELREMLAELDARPDPGEHMGVCIGQNAVVTGIYPIDEGTNLDQVDRWVVSIVDMDVVRQRGERIRRKAELRNKKARLEEQIEELIQEEVRRKQLSDILANSDAGKALLASLEDLNKELKDL